MELRQFLAFKEVIERGGFTRAANHLHLTQSAVSQQVKALEDELGTTLLHRACRQVRLTDAGQVFLTHVRQILAQVEDAQADVAEVVEGVKGNCRVACIPSIAPRILPHLILGFRQAFPHIDMQTRVGSETQLLDWLKEGAVDVCITGLPIACEDIEEKILLQEKFILAVPVEHHFAGRITIKLEELFSEDLILPPHDGVMSTWFSGLCEDVGFKPNVVFESDDLTTRLGMVGAGLGISIESQYLIDCNGLKGNVIVEVEHPSLLRDIGVIWRQSGYRPRNVENFLSILDRVIQHPDLMTRNDDTYPEESGPLNNSQSDDEMALI